MITQTQETAIVCAYADLIGVMQAYEKGLSISELDIDSLTSSIEDLEKAFPELCNDEEAEDVNPEQDDGAVE